MHAMYTNFYRYEEAMLKMYGFTYQSIDVMSRIHGK